MAFTSEDRQEVAARLRKIDCRCAVFDDSYSKLCRDMGGAMGYSAKKDVGMDVFVRKLADLIDPTCYVESIDSTGGLLAYNLSCGDVAFAVQRELRPSYCPYCGARVVEDD